MSTVDRAQFEGVCRTQLEGWQKVLRLQDWSIRLQFWPHEALDTCVAVSKINRDNKSAILVLRYPEDVQYVAGDWPPGEAEDYDLSIVHELLHILVHDMESDIAWAEEQVCNILASVIVNAYRNAQPQSLNPSPSVAGDVSHPGHYL